MDWGIKMSECNYPQCYKCDYDYCIKDGAITQNLPSKKKDRTEYYKEYYKNNTAYKKANYRENYLKRKYPEIESGLISYLEVYNSLTRLKKEIGEKNFNIIIEAIEKIEKE